MHIIGRWCSRVDSEEGRAKFKDFYEMDFYEMMIRHDVTYHTYLSAPKYSHLVFLEYDFTFNQIFSFEEKDVIKVYSDGCMSKEGRAFNTDGMAFFTVFENSKEQGTYCAENSPWDLEDDEFDEQDEDEDTSKEKILENLRITLKKNNIDTIVTEHNVLFVRQL